MSEEIVPMAYAILMVSPAALLCLYLPVAKAAGWGIKVHLAVFLIFFVILLLIAPCYALCSPEKQELYTRDLSERILLTLSIFSYIIGLPLAVLIPLCMKIRKTLIKRRREQMFEWLKALNAENQKRLQGIEKMLTLVQTGCLNEQRIESLLNLLDLCANTSLQTHYCSQSHALPGRTFADGRQSLLSQLSQLAEEYSIPLELEKKPLRQIADEINKLKHHYWQKIYSGYSTHITEYAALRRTYRKWKAQQEQQQKILQNK